MGDGEAPADNQSSEIGRRIRAARARAGVTRKQLAAASGASERYLAHLEAGTGNPSVEMVWSIASALDIAPAELLPHGGERSVVEGEAAKLIRRLPEGLRTELLEWLRRKQEFGPGKEQRLALIGLRGAGKSSLGIALAERLKTPFFEMSKEVERLYGGDIATLIELNGQPALRRYEEQALNAICKSHRSAVIAASGAIVADAALFDQLLRSAHTIWLQASPEDHMGRVIEQGDLRPMGNSRNAMDDLRAILASRAADYSRADATLDTSAQVFGQTLDRLEEIARTLLT
ncbi:MAG: helix-turn-helix domain-containing protein [Caulobacterales bacterium]|nr:helix-turn-helix domain-containing protein [Caulobacterales bacterium]